MTMTTIDVLLVGGGGREHALAWKLLQSPMCGRVIVAPGNGGTQTLGNRVKNVSGAVSTEELVQLAVAEKVGLVVVGPEDQLVKGLQDSCRSVGIPCFGPSKRAAQLEGSKAFAKAFMKRHGIPTAASTTVTSVSDGEAFIRDAYAAGQQLVIKASGLAAGKGVLLPSTETEAIDALHALLVRGQCGDAGSEVVIEHFLHGEECSILAFTDGHMVMTLPAAQDHKRVSDGDQGPNTGGMGAYAPAPVVTPKIMQQIHTTILQPTVDGMRREGTPFVGILYAGVMLTEAGPKLLEYNCRFGDPETQVLLPLLTPDTDLIALMLACCNGHLDSETLSVRAGCVAATVVAASGGYPGRCDTGKVISVADSVTASASADSLVFHAGTKYNADIQLVTSGGRVLAVTGLDTSLEGALSRAYSVLKQRHIQFEGMHYRTDIGHRALNRKQQNVVGTAAVEMKYSDAGVSIDAGNALVEQIKAVVKSTRRPGADADIGGFGGVFDLGAAGYGSSATSDSPLLVAATDGVGTKLKVAQIVGRHDTIGIDLVAMNVNDLVVQAAEPLLFLDYFACGRLDVGVAAAVVQGVAEGCRQANCALVGGETAEMPGLYSAGDYDLAGFTVGAVSRQKLLPRVQDICEGDVVLGIPSSGVHSNGFSLVRHIVDHQQKVRGIGYNSPCPFAPDGTLGEALLTPTRIYVRSLMPAVRSGLVKALAHITGGGFTDNLPRVLPPTIGVTLDARQWPLLPVFKWLKSAGNVSAAEMCRTFNCGVGMVLVVAAKDVAALTALIRASGEEAVYQIGVTRSMKASDTLPQVVVEHCECWDLP